MMGFGRRLAIASLALVVLAAQAAVAREAGNRPARGTYTAPQSSTLLVDFTDGTHAIGAEGSACAPNCANDVVVAPGFPNAACPAPTLDADGLHISIPSGLAASQYCSAKVEPGRIGKADYDLSGGSGAGNDFISIEFETEENASQYNYVSLWLVDDAGSAYTGGYVNRSQGVGGYKRPYVTGFINRFSVDTWNVVNSGPAGWPYKMASIARMEFRYTVHATSNGFPTNITIKRIWKGRAPSLVAFTFDNTYAGVYTYAYPLLNGLGWKGTLFISGDDWNIAGKFTPANLSTMAAAGWTVGAQEYLDNEDVNSYQVTATGLVCSGGVATWTEPTTLTLKQCSACAKERPQVGDVITVRGALDPKWNGAKTLTFVQSGTATPYFQFSCADNPQTPATGNVSASRLTRDEFRQVINASLLEPSVAAAGAKPYMSYSNGRHNVETMGWARDAGIRLARTTRSNITPLNYVQDPRTLSHWKAQMAMLGVSVDQSSSATILGYATNTVLYGGLTSINAHDLVATAACAPCGQSEADKQAYEDAILGAGGYLELWRKGLLDVVSYDQLYRGL
ncbi:MAG: polysaccharide deacetylase family protein [Vicinamibacterales bacterium]